jgi:hypothetical protein
LGVEIKRLAGTEMAVILTPAVVCSVILPPSLCVPGVVVGNAILNQKISNGIQEQVREKKARDTPAAFYTPFLLNLPTFGFQRSEFLLDHGMIDSIVHRKDMKVFIAKSLKFFTG